LDLLLHLRLVGLQFPGPFCEFGCSRDAGALECSQFAAGVVQFPLQSLSSVLTLGQRTLQLGQLSGVCGVFEFALN
jgi:hypothetical protein